MNRPDTYTTLISMRAALTNRRADLPTIERHSDPMDDVLANQLRDFMARDLQRDARTLREIDAALQAIQDGTYGVCVDCEEEIAEKRLAAVVTAIRCRACAEALERRQAAELEGEAA